MVVRTRSNLGAVDEHGEPRVPAQMVLVATEEIWKWARRKKILKVHALALVLVAAL